MTIASVLASSKHEARIIKPDATISEAIARVLEQPVSDLVVSEDGVRVIGIFSFNAIADQVGKYDYESWGRLCQEPVRSMMKMLVCSPHDASRAVLARASGERINDIPVLDEQGQLCGTVHVNDLATHCIAKLLSETDTNKA